MAGLAPMRPELARPEQSGRSREEVVTVAGTSGEAAREVANVPVAVVPSRIEAELILGMLRSNGLNAVLSADDAGGQEPQLQVQGVRVLVARSDEASARQLLAEAEAGDAAP